MRGGGGDKVCEVMAVVMMVVRLESTLGNSVSMQQKAEKKILYQ